MGTDTASATMTDIAKGGMSFLRGTRAMANRYNPLVARRRATSERKMMPAKTKKEIANRWRGLAAFGWG